MICHILLAQEDDQKLLREIGKNGEGRPDEIQQLIDEVLTALSWHNLCYLLLLLHNSIWSSVPLHLDQVYF